MSAWDGDESQRQGYSDDDYLAPERYSGQPPKTKGARGRRPPLRREYHSETPAAYADASDALLRNPIPPAFDPYGHYAAAGQMASKSYRASPPPQPPYWGPQAPLGHPNDPSQLAPYYMPTWQTGPAGWDARGNHDPRQHSYRGSPPMLLGPQYQEGQPLPYDSLGPSASGSDLPKFKSKNHRLSPAPHHRPHSTGDLHDDYYVRAPSPPQALPNVVVQNRAVRASPPLLTDAAAAEEPSRGSKMKRQSSRRQQKTGRESPPLSVKVTYPTNSRFSSAWPAGYQKAVPSPPLGPRPSSLAIDELTLSDDEKPSRQPGKKSRKNKKKQKFENHFQVPGGFPFAPDTVQPDDSLSVASDNDQGSGRPAPSRLASIAPSSSISRQASSAGTLGPKAYQYSPLRDREIRLVRILPARMSTIKCEIFHASLEPPPDYIAISYAWGDADDKRQIKVEGADVPVTVSLHGALGALRKKNKDVYIWADALCIDQQNKEERAQQVRLMTSIYKKASSVAIWLGPEEDDSNRALALLEQIAEKADQADRVTKLISDPRQRQSFAAIVPLFERDYWRRLWVVQEVVNAGDITVYCGSRKLPWDIFMAASRVFWRHKNDLDYYFPRGMSLADGQSISQSQFALSQVLVYQGPSSIPNLNHLTKVGQNTLLEVMRACRRKLSADARDKLYGILGVLPETLSSEFPVDYSLSIKEVYVNIVDVILSTSERLDVICEAIHFPVHTSSANLPTWAPDWSHITETSALGHLVKFSASGNSTADYRFLDEPRRRQLEISAIYLDTIEAHGVPMGTLCTTADYLMAFMHWRALLFNTIDEYDRDENDRAQDAFTRTLCLDQIPQAYAGPYKWLAACYHVFASLIEDRLPYLPLDSELQRYVQTDVHINPTDRRGFLHQHFKRMMGRCFCITENEYLGMGTGFMTAGDIVVVPLGCSTPVILRPEGRNGEYRFVGDVYIHGYMHGKAMEEWKAKKREKRKYVLH